MFSYIRFNHKGTYRANSAAEAVAMWYAEAAAIFVVTAAASVAAAS